MECHLLTVLRNSHQINQLKQIHALIVTRYNSLYPLLVQKLLSLSHTSYARKMFDEMPQRDERLYNSFISAYCRLCSYGEAVRMYVLMRCKDIHITNYTVPPVLKSCSALRMAGLGKQVHSLIISCGLESNCFVQTALMDLYAKSGDLVSARMVFDGLSDRDSIAYNCLISGYSKSGDVLAAGTLFDKMTDRTIVSWNSIISCYAQQGNHQEALRMFERMQADNVQPNEFTLATVLSICASTRDLETGLKLKQYIDEKNTLCNMIVATALMEMFIKCGVIHEARQAFDRMDERDIITWGTMISGYTQNGQPNEALELFEDMKSQQIRPNDVTLVSVLSACAQLGSIEAGENIGSYIESEGFDSNIYVTSAQLSMYSRCGNMKAAWEVFNRMHEKDVVCWNSMITGLAFNGYAMDAIHIYKKMLEANVKPNDVTFVALLSACTHAGLLDLGLKLFHNMHSDHDVLPQIDHYACIVDLFCRYGRLNEAHEFICLMEEEPNVVIWGTLLSACRTHSNMELAEIALNKLLELEPENSGNYVLLSNIYANTGRWQDALRLRNLMRDKKVQKTAAYSWIELEDGVHKFLVADTLHPQYGEIYDVVEGLAMFASDETDKHCKL